MIIYIAGPYTGRTYEAIHAHIYQAREVAKKVWQAGHIALCPHMNTAHFEQDCSLPESVYLEGDLQLLARCDALVLTPDWELSRGATAERAYAEARGIPIFVYPDIPPANPVETRNPAQCQGFIDTVMGMYRTHLRKNADYSPNNILGVGELGLMTRVWDKVARLMNLMGFKFEITTLHFDKPEQPKCEPVADAILDLSVYAVIWQLYRQGKWGK